MTSPRLPAGLAHAFAWPQRHPGVAFVLLILLALLGVVFAARLPVADAVVTAPALLQVRAELPGIDAATVEALVAQPLYEALHGLPGVQSTEMRTRAGAAEVRLQFTSDARRDAALEAAHRHVAAIVPELPSGIDPPTIEARDAPRPAAAVYAVTADKLSEELARWVERVLAEPLRELTKVATVVVEGAGEQEILIQPEARRLAALGLTFDDLIVALQRESEAPRRKRARRSVITPGSAEAIAARAVALPSGEPIALGEVAQVSVRVRYPGDPRRHGSAPALRLEVYARAAADAAYVAERARSHLAWLRANDLIPAHVQVHVLHDQGESARQSFRQLIKRAAAFLAVMLLLSGAVFGARRAALLTSALAVWLPASVALLWLAQLSLNAPVVSGLVLACVALALLVLLPWFTSLVVLSLSVVALAWSLRAAGSEVSSITAFSAAVLAAVVVAWLLTPWSRAHPPTAPLFTRFLPDRARNHWRPIAASAFAAGLLTVASLTLSALTHARMLPPFGSLLLRWQGDDISELIRAGEKAWSALNTLPGVEPLWFSGQRTEVWRLQLDAARTEELGIRLPEIGRALAIAQDGLIVGQTAYGETVFRMRLQLRPGAAGDQFERLLLRGEQNDQRAIYLRDIGLALREAQVREQVAINGEPAVEIAARWSTHQARASLERIGQEASVALVPIGRNAN